MHALIGHLVCREHAAITQNAARHMQLNIWTEVVLVKRTTLERITRALRTMIISEVLQVTFTSLITNRAI
jgi:hypothetical protein